MIILPEDKNIISLLPAEDAQMVLLSLFSEPDDMPDMSPIATMAYTAIKSKSDRISKAQSANGKMGGRPKKPNLTQETQPNPTKPNLTQETQPNPSEANKASVTDTVSVSVTDTEIENGAESSAAADAPRTSTVITLPLNDNTEYAVSEDQARDWAGLYPGIDVEQQLRSMRGWCEANPKKRKTKNGILKFIHGWLAREQDKGSGASSANARASPHLTPEDDVIW